MSGRRWPLVLGVLGAVTAVVLVGTLIWLQTQIRPAGAAGPPVEVTIERGASITEIAELLEEKGVVGSASFFGYYARFKNADGIQAGRYRLRRGEDLPKVLSVLTGGAEPERGERLTVPEGVTLPQVAELVGRLPGRSAQRFLEVAKSGGVRSAFQPPEVNDLEGLLLPETYEIGRNEDEAAIAARMVRAFDDLATRIDLSGGAARMGMTPYQAVIIASMVEREAKVDPDRGPIARVIYNRLERGMPLQIDATVQYALGQQKERLLFSDLEVSSPYNTYKIPGLPPGPIASPGRAALEATLAPPPGPWIYYVLSDANGAHAFATTPGEFERLLGEARRKGLI